MKRVRKQKIILKADAVHTPDTVLAEVTRKYIKERISEEVYMRLEVIIKTSIVV